jgi:hypothetical protein
MVRGVVFEGVKPGNTVLAGYAPQNKSMIA